MTHKNNDSVFYISIQQIPGLCFISNKSIMQQHHTMKIILFFLIIINVLIGQSKTKRHGGKKPHRPNKWPAQHHDLHNHGCLKKRYLTIKTVQKIKKNLVANLFKDRPDRFAHCVRIAFHDCVGGCDGCINRANPGNAGPMLETLDAMDEIYEEKVEKKMSRADFYILTAVTALEESLKFNNANLTENFIKPVKFKFLYGRCDCKTSPHTEAVRRFPSGHFGTEQLLSFFRKEFNFNERESVAIMGAHTLGGASGSKGSGFKGFWKENAVASARLNNRFYSILVNTSLHWENTDVSSQTGFDEERWQWEAGATQEGVPAPFMLNADVSLIRNIQPGTDGKSSCQFHSCPWSPTARYVKKYARNGNKWIRDFVKAWNKMVRKGSRTLWVPTNLSSPTFPIYPTFPNMPHQHYPPYQSYLPHQPHPSYSPYLTHYD